MVREDIFHFVARVYLHGIGPTAKNRPLNVWMFPLHPPFTQEPWKETRVPSPWKLKLFDLQGNRVKSYFWGAETPYPRLGYAI